ncbi:M48 family metalloprotease [Thiohalophilus sp.]|uniref:beta-barrel assembly-enhancing protease n=1 Tax=Thiohalophilus sp. TaxID=3028392 RepID=UPI002ACDAD08|nr:M48 family metalloprotease [Thiohalophilus sp.]MDZ7802830.1 M48 family metalloprotease [Thiohalophilus sp.]
MRPFRIHPGWLLIALLVLTPARLPAEPNLPDIGDAAAGVATPAEEKRVGETVMRNIQRSGRIINDPLIDSYLNHLGYRLIAAGDSDMTDFHFFLIDAPDINAFALPGGYIGIHYGLILSTRTESELASVMAHEIAHVTQRHHARAYDFGGGSSLPVLAALIAAIVLGAQSPEIGQAAIASMTAGSIQSRINFTRANEKEADHQGIKLLANAGFDPNSMASFFEQLHKASRLYGPQGPEFLRTHPVTDTRIADARNRAREYSPSLSEDAESFHLMRNRIKVLTSREPAGLRDQFADNLKSGRYLNRTAERYGYVLSLLETGDVKRARQQLDTLLAEQPQRIAFLLGRAQLNFQQGKIDAALEHYRNALKLYPQNPALTQGYAESLLRSDQADTARQVLRDFLRERDRKPRFYQLLAEAEEKLGNRAHAQIAQGEYYYRTGLSRQAISQFNQALKSDALDFYDAARAEARLQELKNEIAALEDRS